MCIVAESKESTPPHERLHDWFSMIKYPQNKWNFPHERTFRIDEDNLVSNLSPLLSHYKHFYI